MRISYLKLKNYIGIFTGLELNEIEIDFDNHKSVNNIINLLLGRNGSGKTTIMSALNPFRVTNDLRNNIIIEGEKGYKEIRYICDKNEYIIKHYYGKNSSDNKSFISKNGKELNENGGIKTFDLIVRDELGIDKDYFKIGRIGSNVKSFIDLSTSERKKFVSKFLQDIDEYLSAFEIVKNKFNLLNKSMNNLQNQLNKYSDIDTLKEIINTIEKELNEYNVRLNDLTNEKFLLENKNHELLNGLSINEININLKNQLRPLYSKMVIALKKSEDNVNNFYDKYPNLKNYDDEKIISEIALLNNKKEENCNNLSNVENDIKNLQEKIIKIQAKLSEIVINEVTEEEKDRYRDLINDLTSKNISNKLKLDKIKNEDMDNYTIEYLFELKNKMKNFIKELDVIKSNYYLQTMLETKDLDLDETGSQIEILKNNITYNEEKFNNYSIELHKITSKTFLLDSYNKMPKNCNNKTTCPFVASSVEYYEKEMPNIDKLANKKEIIEKAIKEDKKKLEELNYLYDFKRDIINLYNLYKKDISENNLIDIPDSLKFLELIKKKTTDFFEESLLGKVDSYLSILYLENDIKINDENIEKYKLSLDNITKQLELKEILIKEKKEKENDIEDIKNDILRIGQNKLLYEKEINKCNIKINILETLKNSLFVIKNNKNKIDDILNEINKFEELTIKVMENEDNIKLIEKEILSVNAKIEPLKVRLKKNSSDLVLVDNYKKELKNIEDNYENYKLVKDSLDPKQGIPLIFIDNYLTDIAEKTNSLLDIAYNGKFKIQFNITEKDFFIEVYKSDGTMLKDISESSQGELSMTSVSLSLAMIERSIKKYNIIYLDEVDSTLSIDNKRLFIEILQKQLEKLNIEQIFIITHNQEFYTQPIDLILLKNHGIDTHDEKFMEEFMEGKNIIYQYE